MQRVKEVEIAKSIHEFMASRSILERIDFPDCDARCDDCVCIEKASQHARSVPKKSECRRARRSKILPILSRSTNCLHDREIPADVIVDGFYKSKWQNSAQLQTVLALYDQETVRNNGQTSFSRLKTSARLHVDQMMRSRNFRVWNEVAEKGAVTRSQKGKKAYVERKVGQCFQWKTHGQCSKGDSCSFSHEIASGNRGGGQRRKGQSSSPAPNSKATTDGEGEKPSKESGN